MQVHHRQAARRLRVAVGHTHRRCFLQRQHVTQLMFCRERVHQWQFSGARVAEYYAHALLLQQFEQGGLPRHHRHGVSLHMGRCVV
jgi:hypothetical protein